MEALPIEATAFLILFARVGAVLMLLPVFSEDSVAPRIRLLIAFGMAAGLWGILSDTALAAARSDKPLASIVLGELLLGLALGAIVKILFHAISVAGSVVSLQVGLTSAVIFDPAQGSQAPLLSKFVGVAATLVCMAMAVHHLWIASIVKSYVRFPVGTLPAAADFSALAIRVAGDSLTLGIGLAAPLVVYGIIFNVALGLAARLTPAIQIFFITQPLNLLLGLALFATVLGAMLTRFATSIASWQQLAWS